MRRLLAALCAALLLALTACTPRSQTPERHELTYLDVFDTVTTLVAYGGTGEDFSAEAGRIHDELLDYHRLYDIYNDYPDVYKRQSGSWPKASMSVPGAAITTR